MMSDITTELEKQETRRAAPTMVDLIERMTPEIEKLMPGMAERIGRIYLTEVKRVPKLMDCDPASFLGALMQATQLGLEPGPLGHVYLVPFKRQVQLIIGYKGIIDLAYRSERLRSITTGTVRVGDAFEWRDGTRAFLDHTPSGPPADREPTHYYAVAKLTTGGSVFRVLFPEEVEQSRKRSHAAQSELSPWSTDYDQMARKTCVRRLAPLLPQSPVFAQALAADYTEPVMSDDSDE